MAILIETTDGIFKTPFYLGDPFHEMRAHFHKNKQTIITLQADNYELEHILDKFDNIPRHKTARVQYWTGPIAVFIWDHL